MQLFGTVVSATSQALAIVVESPVLLADREAARERLRAHFKDIFPQSTYHSTGVDPHLVRGLHKHARGHSGENDLHPRLVDLVMFHISESMSQAERGLARGYLLLPSPLLIAIEALTIPEEYHSRAYSLLAARIFLSRKLSVWPRNAFTDKEFNSSEGIIDESTLIEQFAFCRTWLEHGDLWSVKADPKKFFVAHYLAARGVLRLRFRPDEATSFMRDGIFASSSAATAKERIRELQFRLSQQYVRVPPPADFMNEILGIPLAIRGSDIVFFNGVKPSVKGGLVVQVSGGPGTGKTTLALALAAALAPIGTQTIYFSVEEEAEDLRSKLRQQIQSGLTALSYYSSDESDWFKTYTLAPADLHEIESEIMRPLAEEITAEKREWPDFHTSGAAIPPLPFLVVLDSLSALSLSREHGDATRADASNCDVNAARADGTWQARRQLSEFVRICRQMRVLVLLITGGGGRSGEDLDYLVDTVINLSVEGSTEHNLKPTRLFTLSKSRQQISRHGTHIFHLSGDSGFRLAPQLSSQMDAQQDLRQLLWDRNVFSEVLNIRRAPSGAYKYVDFLRIHDRSQILLQGKGSSGKAGLALKIALSPRYSAEGFVPERRSPRVLVLSFLYPPAYYETLKQRIEKVIVREAEATALRRLSRKLAEAYVKSMPAITVIHLTPGYLVAEDLHSKLVRKLEEGRLEGRPYTCVVIDGLHNLALQFPGAGDSETLLPIMYGTLARANVTTITTFTTLSLSTAENELLSKAGREFRDLPNRARSELSDLAEESIFRLRVHLPLLHTLVQASDYVFEVFRGDRLRALVDALGGSARPAAASIARYLLSVESAISRDPPTTAIGWQRQELDFCDPGLEFSGTQQSLPIE